VGGRESLQATVEKGLGNYLFVVVSNREPYIHTFSEGRITWHSPTSGLTQALDPVMRSCGGLWIAWGSGDADFAVVDRENRVAVPPDEPRYTLRRVKLSAEDVESFYYGFSNQALWPLCHTVYVRPNFAMGHWEAYKRVNELFAREVLKEVAGKRAIVFVQDYHFALLPRYIKRESPELVVAQFWHIPFPGPDTFRICPWKEEILDGLLGNDLLGFQIQYHCNNFLDAVASFLEARTDYERAAVVREGRTTLVRPFPISVDFEAISEEADSEEVDREMERLKSDLNLTYPFIGVGIDRMDYTKGIPERLRALDLFLEKYPHYRGKIVFVELGVPSRVHIPEYKRVQEQTEEITARLNEKYREDSWQPVILITGQVSPVTLNAMRRLAHFCIVNSLDDGMNLVAKEFVAARPDEDGVLILSRFTGASRELTGALLVNPYSIEELAEAIRKAVEMPREERRSRMQRLRERVKNHDIYHWINDVLVEILKLCA